MAKKQSLEKLENIIDDFSNIKGGMLYRNSFALACYLATQGELQAAYKTLMCLFDVLGWDRRKTYFLDIRDSIEEFAKEYAVEIGGNLEINKLFSLNN